jgi:hypothetical protein
MIGLRDKLDLGREHFPAVRQPKLPGRLGLGPVASRHSPLPDWEERWSESIYMGMYVVNTEQEAVQSRWLHQPFLVRNVNHTNTIAIGQTIISKLTAQSELPVAPMANAQGMWSFIDGEHELGDYQSQYYAQNLNIISPVTIITDVPTKLTWWITNNAGANYTFGLIIDLTFLAPRQNCGNPHPGCQGCPRAPSG